MHCPASCVTPVFRMIFARDAMLARYMLLPGVCISVGRLTSVETAGWIELVFGIVGILCLKEFSYLQNNGKLL